MKFAAATVALAAVAAAAPAAEPNTLAKRDNIDGVILNYALTLEHLEAAFYRQGIQKFGNQIVQGRFKQNLKHIYSDEQIHVKVLTAALRAAKIPAVKPCTYDFGNLTPETFVQTASVLEGIGATAYLGAANLITNRQYLTQAGAILSVESRHNAYLRSILEQSPFPQPFEPALSFNQVFSLAAPFIRSCPPSNPKLPVKAFPKLILTGSQGTYARGSQTRFRVGANARLTNNMFVAYPLVTGNIFVKAFKTGDRTLRAVVPKGEFGPMGQSYAILVNGQGTITDANTIAGPAVVNVLSPYLAGN